MNLKTKAFGLIAALAMCLGLVGTASASNQTNITITMADTGSFSFGFGGTVPFTTQEGGYYTCNAVSGFGDITTTSFQDRATNGTLCLVFTDSLTYRGQFHIDLSATDFLSSVALPYPYTSGVYNIPAQNLAITENYNPHQVRWSSMNNTWGLPVPTYHVGDMGSTTSGGVYSSHDEAWSSNNTMDASHTVTIAFAGTGTIGTFQKIDMSLLVPAALPASAYVSTITATLYPTATLP